MIGTLPARKDGKVRNLDEREEGMRDQDPCEWSITQATSAIRAKAISCAEYCDALMEQASRYAVTNAYIHCDRERVRTDAAALDDGGDRSSTLFGVPLAIKDNINVRGIPTTAGTGALSDFVPETDAPVVARLRASGALVAGKTNMHELAFGCTSNNAIYGPVRNPYATDRIAGGSSGGTAAAVAAHMAPAGLGTDTGASIRLPAALCNIVGFRPTVGRYPTDGVVPISHTRDTPGPMARSVDDTVLLDAVLSGDNTPLAERAPRTIRIGIPREYFFDGLEGATQEVIERAIDELRHAGVTLVEAAVEDVATLNATAGPAVALYEFAHDLPEFLAAHGAPMTLEEILQGVGGSDVRQVIASQLGSDAVTEAAYLHALHVERPKLVAAYAACFASHRIDALLFPTSPSTAPLIGEDEAFEIDGHRVPTFATMIRNANPSTNALIPTISLPAGRAANGLPVGLELDGPYGEDRRLLGVAAAVERIIGRVV